MLATNLKYVWRLVAEFLQTFRHFPPRQMAASFNLDQVMEKLNQPMKGAA